MFNHSSVIQFLNVLIPEHTPPDRHRLSSRIINEYHQYINDLKSVLPHVGPIAFASDIWKDVSAHHIISLSLHTFTMNFEFVSLPISFHLFHEQKLSSNIQAFFEHERDRFNLNTRILAGITIDNGPDLKSVASYNILGPRFACLAHCLNLTVHHGLSLWEKPNAKKYPFDSAHHEINDSLINDEDDELTSDFPPNTSSISLGVLEDNIQTEKPRDNEEIYKFLVRVHHLISKVRVFVSMTRQVTALQRHIYNKLGLNKAGFILDVR
ncbi:unnamed protein product, partial [Rotaria sordida]